MENLVTSAKAQLKLNGEQLASALGVHPSTISRWESAGRVTGPAKRLIEDMLASKQVPQ